MYGQDRRGEPRADPSAQGTSASSQGSALGRWQRPRWPLVNRGSGRAAIDDLLERVRQGFSGVLALRSGAGLGKTTLVNYAVEDRAAGLSLARTARSYLEQGASVAVHCRNGIGTWEQISAARGMGVPDTSAQREAVASWRPRR